MATSGLVHENPTILAVPPIGIQGPGPLELHFSMEPPGGGDGRCPSGPASPLRKSLPTGFGGGRVLSPTRVLDPLLPGDNPRGAQDLTKAEPGMGPGFLIPDLGSAVRASVQTGPQEDAALGRAPTSFPCSSQWPPLPALESSCPPRPGRKGIAGPCSLPQGLPSWYSQDDWGCGAQRTVPASEESAPRLTTCTHAHTHIQHHRYPSR